LVSNSTPMVGSVWWSNLFWMAFLRKAVFPVFMSPRMRVLKRIVIYIIVG